MNKLPFIAFFIFLTVAITVTAYVKMRPASQTIPFVEQGQEYGIAELRVLSGHEFSIKLEDGRNIHAFLEVKTIPEATKEVVQKVHKVSQCSLLCRSRLENGWLVDILVVECSDTGESCRRVSLTQWLQDNHLIWER
jgi:hypothetical protein